LAQGAARHAAHAHREAVLALIPAFVRCDGAFGRRRCDRFATGAEDRQ